MLPDTQKYAEQLLKAESKMKEIEKIKDQIAATKNFYGRHILNYMIFNDQNLKKIKIYYTKD